MPKNSKTYSLRGKVRKVYPPRQIKTKWGSKEVSDLYLILDSGAEVKISFWDTDIAHHEGSVAVINALNYTGKYKDIPQYSSTKETKISPTNRAESEPESEQESNPEGATLEAQPEFGDDGAPEVEVPEGAEEENVMPVAVAKKVWKESAAPLTPVTKAATAEKRNFKPAVVISAPVVVVKSQIDSKVLETTVALAQAAMEIAQTVSTDLVAKDAQAFQALFATIFIRLDRNHKG